MTRGHLYKVLVELRWWGYGGPCYVLHSSVIYTGVFTTVNVEWGQGLHTIYGLDVFLLEHPPAILLMRSWLLFCGGFGLRVKIIQTASFERILFGKRLLTLHPRSRDGCDLGIVGPWLYCSVVHRLDNLPIVASVDYLRPDLRSFYEWNLSRVGTRVINALLHFGRPSAN